MGQSEPLDQISQKEWNQATSASRGHSLDIYRHLATIFPKLRITMEHITTADAVRLLDEYENLFATRFLQRQNETGH